MFEKIKKWYEMGLWTEKHVRDAFAKGVITAEEATRILQR